ncbi:MAG: hypothetical protein K8823_968 [Cenarchaeum symbiont of Oopsacas minuta]|nr:hypothetical protein [Cenarchaeum symbiont of Oopsacas minuta]
MSETNTRTPFPKTESSAYENKSENGFKVKIEKNDDLNHATNNDEDYHTVNIKINLPKQITKNLTHNSRDVLLYHIIIDLLKSKNTLYMNKNNVFWKNGMPPNVALLELTKERELLTHKIIQDSIKNIVTI